MTERPNQPSRAPDPAEALAASLFSEVLITAQLARDMVRDVLPKGMQISHFSALNLLAHLNVERTPAELADAFSVTRGAMSNTVARLEWAGYVHVRPDWDDARRKFVSISPAGRVARDAALAALMPKIAQVVHDMGADQVRATLPVLRLLRKILEEEETLSRSSPT